MCAFRQEGVAIVIREQLENSPLVYYKSTCKDKEWVLLIHAAFVNHQMFRTQIAYFSDKFNIIAIDVIGHGQSLATRKGDSINEMSAWIKQILLKENIEKVHLLGVSLGAVLVQDFANHHPEMVQSLACFGGYDINNFDTRLQKSNRIAQMAMMLKAIFSIEWFAQANKKISAYTASAQDEFFEMNMEFPKRSFMYLASINDMVNKHKPTKRNHSLLIGCGEHDNPMALTAIKMWGDSELNCEMVVFKGAGHCANMDVPQEFNAVIERFWSGS
jgi:pimeloyl-ACP methyl ester carboxylesterase